MGSGGIPEAQGFYTKLSSDEHILNLICDTGRSRIGVGSRGRSPRKFRGFGLHKLLSDEHAFYTLLVTLVGHELAWGPGCGAPRSPGVLGNK